MEAVEEKTNNIDTTGDNDSLNDDFKCFEEFMRYCKSNGHKDYTKIPCSSLYFSYFKSISMFYASFKLKEIFTKIDKIGKKLFKKSLSSYIPNLDWHIKNLDPYSNSVFSRNEFKQFLLSLPSENNILFYKVILIIGVCGGLSSNELFNLKLSNVIKIDEGYKISFGKKDNFKILYDGCGSLASYIDKYLSLYEFDENEKENQFFKKWCAKSSLYSKIATMDDIRTSPSKIANILDLHDSNSFSPDCFRRTAIVLQFQAGATISDIKRFGRWETKKDAGDYVQESLSMKRSTQLKLGKRKRSYQTLFDELPVKKRLNSNLSIQFVNHNNNE